MPVVKTDPKPLEERWSHPTAVDDATLAFPANIRELMPAYDEIPKQFKGFRSDPWVEWQGDWFFKGLGSWPETKPGIDPQVAKRHLSSIQGSFQPKHEHKSAAVAYLASLWLVAPTK